MLVSWKILHTYLMDDPQLKQFDKGIEEALITLNNIAKGNQQNLEPTKCIYERLGQNYVNPLTFSLIPIKRKNEVIFSSHFNITQKML